MTPLKLLFPVLSAAVLGCIVALGAAGCRSGDAWSAEPVRVIFDTDMYTDYDDAGALGLLHAPAALDIYRRVLAAQPDGSVALCSVGFLNNVAELLEKERDLFARKVKAWYVMGCTPNGREFNIYNDVKAAKKAIAECPVPIVYSDYEYGRQVKTGRPLLDLKDERNPVKDVFRARLNPDLKGHESWDLVTVLAAVRGVEFFANAEHGRYEITDDRGTSVWHPDPTARDCRLVEKESFRAVGALIDGYLTRPSLHGF